MKRLVFSFTLTCAAVLLHYFLSGCAPTMPTTKNPKVVEAANLDAQGNLPAALAALDQAIRENPRDAVAWNNRGNIYLRKGLPEKAIEDFSRAISIQETGLYYANRGLANIHRQFYDNTIADLSKAIELRYKEVWAYHNRAAAYYWKGRFPEALSDANHVIQQDSNYPAAYGTRCLARVQLEQYADALGDCERYLAANHSDDLLVLALQGKALLKTGNVTRARENVRKMTELDPRLAVNFSGDRALDVYDWDKRRAMVKQAYATAQEAESGGKLQDAFHHYDMARTWGMGYSSQDRAGMDMIQQNLIRLYARIPQKPTFPEEARRFGVQAVSMAEQKRYDEAATLYERAFVIAPWWGQGHFNRALLLAEQSRYQDAIKEMKLFVELAPNAAETRAAQDKIYEWELKAK